MEQLIHQYEPLIQSLAYRFGNENNRDDVMQEARMGLLEAAHRFKPENGHLGAYVKKMAWGKAMKFRNRENRYNVRHPHPMVTDENGAEISLLDLIPAEEEAFSYEDRQALHDLLSSLSIPERVVIHQFYFLGLGLKEMAICNKESLETVRSRKKRVILKLRKTLEK